MTVDNRRKKQLLFGVVGFLLIMQIAAKNSSDALLQILNETENTAIREKILVFSKGETEQKVNATDYSVDDVVDYAKSLLGTPHRMGGKTPIGLDCSGLVMLAHAKFSINLPHSSQEQARFGTIIPPGEELKKGDLVFFHSTYSTQRLVTHSGIYLEDGKFIHTSTSRGVMISQINEDDGGYWSEHYLFATRLSN